MRQIATNPLSRTTPTTLKKKHRNLANCVYNTPHRTRYNHHHKLVSITVTRCTTTANPSHSHEARAKGKHNQRSSKNQKSSSSDHQEDQPRLLPCWKQELTQRDNKEVHSFPSANIEHPRHQASLVLFLYDQLSKLQQIPFQEHPLQ